GQNHSPGLDAPRPLAHGKAWIISPDGFGADNNGVDKRAKLLRVSARGFRSEPARFAWRASQIAIQTHATFRNYKWFAADDPFVKRFIQPRTFVFYNDIDNVNSGRAEMSNRA